MCKKPILVPNYYHTHSPYCSEFGEMYAVPKHLRSQSQYIEVPCGKCVECRNTYYTSLLQRGLCEAMSSFVYFVTLTYDDQHVPLLKLDDQVILYADYSHIQDMFKRLRNNEVLDRDFRYLCVNEYGDKFSRPHFHLLIFVSKMEGDDDLTPYRIERILYDNLKVYFSVNVGTRKCPIYEPLFTFSQRVTPNGIKSNYWVKFIESTSQSNLKDLDISPFFRSLSYLIGYVNTPNRLDSFVSDWVASHSYDTELCSKVKRVLSNSVRFSKGFGCGFDNGKKFYLPKISVSASSNLLTYTELVDNLPSVVDDFKAFYPHLYNDLLDWVMDDRYSDFDSLDSCLQSLSVDEFYLHLLTIRYFSKQLSNHLRSLYKKPLEPTISSFFTINRPYRYSLKPVRTSSVVDSPLYRFLRKGVDESIRVGLPFFAFINNYNSSYSSLCKYYRDRVCTLDDFQKLLDVNYCKDYDELREKFIKSYNTRMSDLAVGNLYRNSENSEIIFAKQKKSLYLRSRSCDLYETLFVL